MFISYNSADRKDAEFLRDFLESAYIPCWMAPRDIPVGANYAAIIPQAIRKARFFLILVSKNSTQSEQVANELNIAATDKRCIIACHLDDQPLNEMSDVFRYHLGTKQWIDGYQRQSKAASEIVQYIYDTIKTMPVPEIDPQQEMVNRNPVDKKKGLVHIFLIVVVMIGWMAMQAMLYQESGSQGMLSTNAFMIDVGAIVLLIALLGPLVGGRRLLLVHVLDALHDLFRGAIMYDGGDDKDKDQKRK